MLPKNVLRYGKDEPQPPQIALRAGPLSLIYEQGDLRYIRLGEREVVRRIYVAVRDRNWGTVPPVLSNVQIADHGDSFQITYDAAHRRDAIDFVWRGTISGDARGTIRFAMDGVARATFLSNRIGFCVLHPGRECAGASARIEHVDGTVEDARFPQSIAPQAIIGGVIQPVHPFSEMRAIAHEIAPDVWADVRFEGEIFELEDQRNWIDGSFKTYGTPLRLPFPSEIAQGTSIAQAVMLTLRAGHAQVFQQRASIQPSSEARVRLALDETPSFADALPRIGLGAASHGQTLTGREIERLRALNLAHMRVDLWLAEADFLSKLERATREAQVVGVPLEMALFLSAAAEDELRALADALRELRPKIWTWLVFPSAEPTTSERLAALARRHLAACDPAALIGGGTNVYFTELNRARPPVAALDLVCYSINPQVHAVDDASLAETCATIAKTIQSARQFAGSRPIAVTPVTLKPRFNPVATGPAPAPKPGELPPQVDARQMSLFGAGWTLCSLKYIAAGGAASTTFYETTGWRGVMETEAGAPLPALFRSIPGAVFPLYHVLADVGEFAAGQLRAVRSSAPLRVDGMALRKTGRTSVMLANLTAAPQHITLQGIGALARIRMLDETNAEEAMRAPEAFRARASAPLAPDDGVLELTLRPYAIARIDIDTE